MTILDNIAAHERLRDELGRDLDLAPEEQYKWVARCKALAELLRESKREHYRSETDDMDNCPMTFSKKECAIMCTEHECTCGATEWNVRVDTVLKET